MLWSQLIGFTFVCQILIQEYYANSQDAAISNCSINFTLVYDKCLLAVNNWINWYEADRHCRSMNAGLLSLQSPIARKEVTNWIAVHAPYSLEIWTSGNSLGKKGFYYWQSTGQTANYLPWSPDQPQPATGDCLTLYTISSVNKDYHLAIRNCHNMQPFVCEHKPQKTSKRICLIPAAYEKSVVVLT